MAGCLLAIALWWVMDAVLFRSGIYGLGLNPESSTGRFEVVFRAEARRGPNARKQVLAIGDSRMALLPRVANESGLAPQLWFATAAVPGSTPRSWYYMIRDLDPSADRYAAILITLDSYRAVDQADLEPDREADQTFMANRLRLADIPEFVRSFRDPVSRWRALRASLFKGFAFQSDLHDLLTHPRRRRELVVYYRDNYAREAYSHRGEDRTMEGIAVDWARRTATFPAWVSEAQRRHFLSLLFPPAVAQTGITARFRREWLGKIIDHYRGRPVRVLFVRPPRGPLTPPPELAGAASPYLEELRSRPGVIVLDEHLFDDLERPAFFMDPVHLNAGGLELFSRRIAYLAGRLL